MIIGTSVPRLCRVILFTASTFALASSAFAGGGKPPSAQICEVLTKPESRRQLGDIYAAQINALCAPDMTSRLDRNVYVHGGKEPQVIQSPVSWNGRLGTLTNTLAFRATSSLDALLDLTGLYCSDFETYRARLGGRGLEGISRVLHRPAAQGNCRYHFLGVNQRGVETEYLGESFGFRLADHVAVGGTYMTWSYLSTKPAPEARLGSGAPLFHNYKDLWVAVEENGVVTVYMLINLTFKSDALGIITRPLVSSLSAAQSQVVTGMVEALSE